MVRVLAPRKELQWAVVRRAGRGRCRGLWRLVRGEGCPSQEGLLLLLEVLLSSE